MCRSDIFLCSHSQCMQYISLLMCTKMQRYLKSSATTFLQTVLKSGSNISTAQNWKTFWSWSRRSIKSWWRCQTLPTIILSWTYLLRENLIQERWGSTLLHLSLTRMRHKTGMYRKKVIQWIAETFWKKSYKLREKVTYRTVYEHKIMEQSSNFLCHAV